MKICCFVIYFFLHDAPVAQWIRALGYGPREWGFESLRACHFYVNYFTKKGDVI